MHLGVRTLGNDPDGSCVLLVGTYASVGAVGQRLLDVRPPLLVLRQDEWDGSLLQFLADETVRGQPGQAVVLDRLLDLVLVAVLRAWFARPDAELGTAPPCSRPGPPVESGPPGGARGTSAPRRGEQVQLVPVGQPGAARSSRAGRQLPVQRVGERLPQRARHQAGRAGCRGVTRGEARVLRQR